MAKSLEAWKNSVWNKRIDFDNASYDCVDVSKSWIMYLTDKPWQESAGWGNAKDIYFNWYGTYLERVPRGNAPKLGDIVVMNGQIGGGYGHTGVVVGISGQNITIYQQDTFTQQPVFTGVFNAYVSYIQGFLRPKVPFTIGAAAPLEPYQRITSYAAKYREQPNSTATLLATFDPGEVVNFKGFVKGEVVDGNDIWFVGRFTGGYSWSGAYTDSSTHDLPDLTPVKLEAHQRQVGNSVINYRKLPEIQPSNVISTFNPGGILDFDAWTKGTSVDGNNIWFRGKYTGGWAHAGGFTNATASGLPEVSLAVEPTPVEPTPAPDLTKKVVDISSHNKVTDYNKLKAAVRGVVAKAGHTGKSYGGTPVNGDPTFASNKVGLGDKLVGAYWYAYPSLDAVTEAKNFVDTVGVVPHNFSYWLDIETNDGLSDLQVNAWAQDFLEEVDRLTNKVCGLYMNRNWYATKIFADTKGSRPIWLAHYGTPEMSNPVANQVAHQYTETGSVAGVEGYVDENAVLDSFFLPTVITPSPNPVPDEPIEPPVPNPDYDVNFIVRFFNALVKFITEFFQKK